SRERRVRSMNRVFSRWARDDVRGTVLARSLGWRTRSPRARPGPRRPRGRNSFVSAEPIDARAATEFWANGEIGDTPLETLRAIQQTSEVSMGPRSRRRLLGPLNRLFRTGTLVGLSDGQLLERFVRYHDEAAEAAFEVLVERHGPMVLGVCRRVLRDLHDA